MFLVFRAFLVFFSQIFYFFTSGSPQVLRLPSTPLPSVPQDRQDKSLRINGSFTLTINDSFTLTINSSSMVPTSTVHMRMHSFEFVLP